MDVSWKKKPIRQNRRNTIQKCASNPIVYTIVGVISTCVMEDHILSSSKNIYWKNNHKKSELRQKENYTKTKDHKT